MKIKINENEVYELKLPEQVDNVNEFFVILTRLDNIAKIIKMNMIAGTNLYEFKDNFQKRETNKIQNKDYVKKSYTHYKNNTFFDTKEKVMDLIQYYYHGTIEDKNRICKIIGINRERLTHKLRDFISIYNIKPEEVGFIMFGTTKKKTGIKVNDYIIKSYTGIFDENGNN
jgi:hypothetical protein